MSSSRQSVGFTCPRCLKGFSHSIEHIRQDPVVFCPHCRSRLDHREIQQLREKLREAIIDHQARYRGKA